MSLSKKLRLRHVAALLLFLAPALTANAYRLQGPSWPDKTAVYDVKTETDTFDAAFIEAMAKWNGRSNFSFTHRTGYFDPCGSSSSPDRKNSYRFSTNNCGKGWNSSTLAVTSTWSSGGKTVDTDIVFNSRDHSWGLYNDSISNHGNTDFRRVATHELGHALGLSHETVNDAIMQPYVSNVIDPLQDDINGLRAIYGGTGSGNTNKTLTVSVNGSGSVTSSPAGINCPGDCSQQYNQGTSVTLTAHPASGQRFKQWGGACSGSASSCTVSLSANKSVSAEFEVIPTTSQTLYVFISGSGSVTSSPAGIDCPGDCSQRYSQGTSVTLTPDADSGWQFKQWGGACSGTGACTVSVTSFKYVRAVFEINSTIQHALTVSVDGSGSVTSSPAGIDCPGDCSGQYNEDTSVTLTPHADTGWQFRQWSGDCSGTGACIVPMTSGKNVTALFGRITTTRPNNIMVPIWLLLLEDD